MKIIYTLLLSLLSLWGYSQSPVVDAGADQTLHYPNSQTTLVGSATIATGSIKSYSWAKVSGSKYGYIVSQNRATVVIKTLRVGVYTFKLTATGVNGSHHLVTGSDIVVITIDSSSPATLQANAGGDQSIGRFQGYALLNGSLSTGTITASNWQLLTPSSPEDGVAYIDERTQLSTSTHLMPYGNYSYQLSVTNSTLTKTLSADQVNQPCSFLKLNNTTSLTTGMTVFGQFIKGNTIISSIGHDTIFLSKSIVYPIYTGNVITFATGSGDLSKDTVNIVVNWQTSLPPQRVSWHKVTAGTLAIDRSTCPFCNVGNFIIDGANDGFNIGGSKTDIYIPTGTFAGLPSGTKIFVKGGIYGDINFDLNDNEISGDTITNYSGRLEGKRIRFKNPPNCTITAQYVNGVSGDPNYLGWDGGYTFPEGTFGIFANDGWQSLQAPCFAILGNAAGVTLKYVEGGNGGFAGLWYKEDPQGGQPDYDNVHVYKCYFHDTGGEGWYFGLTNSDNPTPAPNLFNSSQFNDNLVTRSGNELYQVGQLGSNNYFHNNTGVMGAVRWRSAFQESQYFGGQFGIRNGKNNIDSNIFVGSGEQTLSAIAYNRTGLAYDGGTLTFRADAFQYSKGFIANYLQGLNGANIIGMPILFDSCVNGNSYFYEDSVFNQFFPNTITAVPNYTNTSQMLRAAVDSNTVTIRKTYRDNTKTTLIANAATIDTSGTTAVSSLPLFDWNSGFDTSNYRTYSMWGNWVFASLGDEFTNQLPLRQGKPIVFQLGDMVCWLGKYYVSKINGNWNHIPVGVTDSYWTLKTWTKNGSPVTYPPDDYRLSSTNFYYLRGMGLTTHK